MTEHKVIAPAPVAHNITEPEIVQINKDYRFRRHVLLLSDQAGEVIIWNLEKRHIPERGLHKGETIWQFIANDRSPIRLGNYCAARGIMPDPEATPPGLRFTGRTRRRS